MIIRQMRYIFLLISLFSVNLIHSQTTIYGFVEDSKTKERLPSVTVYDFVSQRGVITNSFGFYSITLPENDSVTLVFRMVGYESQTVSFKPNTSKNLNIKLVGGIELSEVVVTADKSRLKSPEMSVLSIPVKQILEIPSLMGEVDIARAFQLMPGVHGGKEGTSGIYVRGGSPDQNLILLDDIYLYSVNHIGGYLSVFNTDAIKNVELYKGGFPARYGGRLSAVMDIRMKEGSMTKYSGDVTIGIISSKFTIEGPIWKDKTSFIVSARRSLFDLIMLGYQHLYYSDDKSTAGYALYDVNAKVNHIINQNNRIYVSFYSGRDKIRITQKDYDTQTNYPFNFKGINNLNWGNYSATFRWNYIYKNRLFSNLTLGSTNYFYNSLSDIYKIEKQSNKTIDRLSDHYLSSINDLVAKIDLDYTVNRHQIRFGGETILHRFSPTMNKVKLLTTDSNSIDTTFGAKTIKPVEYYIYLEDKILATERISFNIGSHFNLFSTEGKTFWSIEPRAIGNFILIENLSLKASYSKMSQAVHLLSNHDAGIPTDLWVPATKKAPPQKSSIFALGLAGELEMNIEWSLETFYKTFKNLIEFSEGSSFFTGSADWQEKIENNGKGNSYGIELLVHKKTGKTTGWISYCLSKNTRQFDKLNFGKPFPYKYDHRHDFSITVSHKFSDKFQISGLWVFTSGNAVTLPSTKYEIYVLDYTPGTDSDNNFYDEAHVYGERNNYRAPAYHRLDVNLSFTKNKKYGIRKWSFGVYNAYNRLNTYYLFFKYDKNGNRKLYSFSLFPIMPSISYSYTF